MSHGGETRDSGGDHHQQPGQTDQQQAQSGHYRPHEKRPIPCASWAGNNSSNGTQQSYCPVFRIEGRCEEAAPPGEAGRESLRAAGAQLHSGCFMPEAGQLAHQGISLELNAFYMCGIFCYTPSRRLWRRRGLDISLPILHGASQLPSRLLRISQDLFVRPLTPPSLFSLLRGDGPPELSGQRARPTHRA